jgi:hypothetical protein
MAKQKVRVVVEMYGGTIQAVHTDSEVELDVVFLEDPKYANETEAEEEFEVEKGAFKGQIIFTNQESQEADAANLDPVFEAAEKRNSAT